MARVAGHVCATHRLYRYDKHQLTNKMSTSIPHAARCLEGERPMKCCKTFYDQPFAPTSLWRCFENSSQGLPRKGTGTRYAAYAVTGNVHDVTFAPLLGPDQSARVFLLANSLQGGIART